MNLPGVFVEEARSGGRTIMPVATSITAFVGRAARGPVETPLTVASFAEFERMFGGLWSRSTMGFAVRDFFANGGSTAIVVRLYRRNGARAKASLTLGSLVLEAASEGRWGNHLKARVMHGAAARFHLHIRDEATGVVEEHRDLVVSPKGDPRHVVTVLANESTLVRATAVGRTRPAATGRSAPDASVIGEGVAGDGSSLTRSAFTVGGPTRSRGLYALNRTDLFNILVIPPHRADGNVGPGVVAAAAAYCESRRAMLILDAPSGWDTVAKVDSAFATGIGSAVGTTSANAAVYFPRLRQANPLRGNQVDVFASAGAVAGVIARTDTQRGVWKSPAGIEATLNGVVDLSVPLTDQDIGVLNRREVSCLRSLDRNGAMLHVVWGARTLQGFEGSTSEWRYVPVRRMALFLEESLARGLQWAAFEPNGEPLWAQIRLTVGEFLETLYRQGAFLGPGPQEAYFVRCDATTTTQADVERGVVVIEVGFAPLKPAEFVILRLQQVAAPALSTGG